MDKENPVLVDDDGISLSEIFGWIRRKWIVLVSVTISLALIIILAFGFLIAPSKSTYNIKFSYDKTISLNKGKYLDGTTFDARDIIKLKNLSEIKNSDDKFNDIDIEKLAKDENLKINQDKRFEQDKQGLNKLVSVNYEIIIPSKYFDSKETAMLFLVELVNTPIEYNLNYLNKLNMFNFESINNSKSYDDTISFLDATIDYISTGYEDLITMFGNPYIYEGDSGILLNQCYQEFKFNVNKSNYEFLKLDHKTYSYIKDYNFEKQRIVDYMNVLAHNIADKDVLLKSYKTQLDELRTQSNGNDFGQSISTLINKITVLETEVHSLKSEYTKYVNIIKSYDESPLSPDITINPEYIIKDYINKDYVKDTIKFEKSLNEVQKMIEKEADRYTNVYKSLYERNANVLFLNNGIISVNKMSSIIIIALGLFAGFGVGVVIAGYLGYQDSKKEQEVK